MEIIIKTAIKKLIIDLTSEDIDKYELNTKCAAVTTSLRKIYSNVVSGKNEKFEVWGTQIYEA